MTERLLKLSETCERLCVNPNTLRKWERQGKIRVVRTLGGRRRILKARLNV